MITHYEGCTKVSYRGSYADLWEILDKFAENDDCGYVHRVDDSGCDAFDITWFGFETRNVRFHEISDAIIPSAIEDFPHMIHKFMPPGLAWENGNHMTPEIALSIVSHAIC